MSDAKLGVMCNGLTLNISEQLDEDERMRMGNTNTKADQPMECFGVVVVATEIRQFRNPLDIVFCQSIQFSRFHWPFHVDTSSEIFDDVTPDLSSFAALLASLACNFSTQEFGDRSNPRLTRRGFAKFLQTLTYSRRFSNARRIFCRSVGLRFIFLFGTGVVVV